MKDIFNSFDGLRFKIEKFVYESLWIIKTIYFFQTFAIFCLALVVLVLSFRKEVVITEELLHMQILSYTSLMFFTLAFISAWLFPKYWNYRNAKQLACNGVDELKITHYGFKVFYGQSFLGITVFACSAMVGLITCLIGITEKQPSIYLLNSLWVIPFFVYSFLCFPTVKRRIIKMEEFKAKVQKYKVVIDND